jgi:hypothetical protein
VVVLLRGATTTEFLVAVLVAELVAVILRVRPPSLVGRVWTTAVRLAAALAALAVYRLVLDAGGSWDARWHLVLALAAAAVAMLVADELLVSAATRRRPGGFAGRSADLTLLTSGVLMALAYGGAPGHEGMGLWAPLIFSVPLVAGWYSFERLASIRRTYQQTIGALSAVPELAGLVREGHATRVAALAGQLGHELGLSRDELEYLRAASLLHHLGHLCLDAPEVRGAPIEAWEVADKGAEILRQTDYLAPAGDILASDATGLGAQVLKIASAFDELTEGDERRAHAAVEALYSGPGYVYDVRVLAVLDRVVGVAPGTAVNA